MSEIPREVKAKVRTSRETIIYIDILPSELRLIADRLDEGGVYNETIDIYGSLDKERITVRFIARTVKP